MPRRANRNDRRQARKEQERFAKARRAEYDYVRRLRQVAAAIGSIVSGLADTAVLDESGVVRVTEALRRYAALIQPWARATGARMIAEVSRRDARAWSSMSSMMSGALHQELQSAPIGEVVKQRLAAQVDLITSLPLEAARRVHEWTLRGLETGARPPEIAAQILRTGEVTANRAKLIARTEVGRTATELTRARAEHIGSDGYIWLTVRDSDVRPSHRAMEGKFVRWDDPPTLDGMTGHAGSLPNCRCVTLPIVPQGEP